MGVLGGLLILLGIATMGLSFGVGVPVAGLGAGAGFGGPGPGLCARRARADLPSHSDFQRGREQGTVGGFRIVSETARGDACGMVDPIVVAADASQLAPRPGQLPTLGGCR
jgi:hypothetical protein